MDEAISLFKSKNIPVLEPGQGKYERAVATSNLIFRFSRPPCVVQPKTIDHVKLIVNEARKKKLKVTIKGNGHSYAGHSTAFEGISLDLRKLREVDLDMKSKTVTVLAGCQWGHVYGKLVDGRHNGYAINGGRCPTVGVSGFILGGGLGPFTRSFGMGCDTLVEATLVTAQGDLVTVGERDDPSSKEGKLFWALRGAGGGNFGVLVKMKLRVQKLRSVDHKVVAGRFQWFPKDGFVDEVIPAMVDFYTTPWPDEMTIDSTWTCDLRDNNNLDGVRFTIAFNGNKFKYQKIIDENIKNPVLKTQLKRRAMAEKSTRFLHETLVSQWLDETKRAYPENKTYELYSSFVFGQYGRETMSEITSVIWGFMQDFREKFKGEKVNFLVTWIHSGGRAAAIRPTDTAFFWREAVFHTYVTVEWVDKWMEKDMRFFLADVKTKLRAYSLGGKAAFINFPDRDFPRKSHEQAYFGGNSDKLREVKDLWDADNFFKFEQGVKRTIDPEEDEDGSDTESDEEEFERLADEQWDNYNTSNIQRNLDYLADIGL